MKKFLASFLCSLCFVFAANASDYKVIVAQCGDDYYAMSSSAGSADNSFAAVEVSVVGDVVVLPAENVNLYWNVSADGIISAIAVDSKNQLTVTSKANIMLTNDGSKFSISPTVKIDGSDRAIFYSSQGYFRNFSESNMGRTSGTTTYSAGAVVKDYIVEGTEENEEVAAYLTLNDATELDEDYAAEVVNGVAEWSVPNWNASNTFKISYDGKFYGSSAEATTLENRNAVVATVDGEGFALPAAATGKVVTIKFAVDTKNICATWSEGEIPTPGTEEKSFTIVYGNYFDKEGKPADNNTDFSAGTKTATAAELYAALVESQTFNGNAKEEAISAFVSGSKVYDGAKGIKFSTSSANGNLTIKFNEGNVKKATKVTVEAYEWLNENGKTDNNVAFAVTPLYTKAYEGTEADKTTVELGTEGGYVITLDGNKDLTGLQFDAKKRVYLKSIKVVWYNESTGIEGVESEAADVAPVYYNLQGARVDNPSNGLYIVVRGNKVTKEIIR